MRRTAKAEAEAEAKAEAEAEAKAEGGRPPLVRKYLDHERMQAYQDALRLYALVDELSRRLSRMRRFEVDQMRRGSLSILLNTAEGAGEQAPLEKARFYRIARRSATECAALFHALAVVEPAQVAKCREGRTLTLRITAQLTGLCRAMEERAAAERG